MKKYLLVVLIFPLIVLGQDVNKFELPSLKYNDSIIIMIKRNRFQEKIILNKSKCFTRITFFKKTIVLSLNEEVNISNKKKEKTLQLIEDFNDKNYQSNEQIIIGYNNMLNYKYLKIKELFILTEERIVYRTFNNVIFINPSKMVIAGQYTDVTILLNDKILKKIRISGYLLNNDILFR